MRIARGGTGWGAQLAHLMSYRMVQLAVGYCKAAILAYLNAHLGTSPISTAIYALPVHTPAPNAM